jgi:[ribosomal protein S18]-alanine N-acetyltransferase
MVVRPARTDEARSLALVIAAVAVEGFLGAEPPVDVEERAQRLREAIEGQGGAALWTLEDDGAVVGMAGVQERIRGVLHLGMAIVPEARGRGGGRLLVEAVLEHAYSVGAHKVDLEAWSDNGRAIALYSSAGFEVEGVRRDHYRRRDGRLRSTIVMGRRLARIVVLDHVLLAAPAGCEQQARWFYGELLGLPEIDKPLPLNERGGVWFGLGEQQLHVGVQEPFTPARKAHPALRIPADELDALAKRLAAAGAVVRWDDALPDVRRFFSEDPWGNRIELLAGHDPR